MTYLENFEGPIRAVIVGASGGIGQALTEALLGDERLETLYLLSRSEPKSRSEKVVYLPTDITNESDIKNASGIINKGGPLTLVIIASGFLHDERFGPEKTIRSLSFETLNTNFNVNCFGPAILAKYLLPLMDRKRRTAFTVLSARVGSISDNRLGGWYAYRASKSALNMIIKTLSIEFSHRYKNLTIMGLHPGTVNTGLSEPFQGNVPEGKLFTAEFSAAQLLTIINESGPEHSGTLRAWDGQTVPF